MPKDAALTNFYTGEVRRVALKMMQKRGKACGAEILEAMAPFCNLSPGTLYPILGGMEEDGLCKVQAAIVGGKQRKNYSLTPKGKKVLGQMEGFLRKT